MAEAREELADREWLVAELTKMVRDQTHEIRVLKRSCELHEGSSRFCHDLVVAKDRTIDRLTDLLEEAITGDRPGHNAG